MKNNLLSGILAIAVVVLYILHFSSGTGNDDVKDVEISNTDTTAIDSSANFVNLSDTSSLDSLKVADYSRIGFIDMFAVVEKCPSLKKDLETLEKRQISLQRQEAQIYEEFQQLKAKKEKELEMLHSKGLLDQVTYQQELQAMAVKQQEAEQKVLNLRPKAENLQKSQMKITQRRNKIVKEALDEINEKIQLDYVLVQDGMNTSVFPLNAKNDITEQIILVVNKNNQ